MLKKQRKLINFEPNSMFLLQKTITKTEEYPIHISESVIKQSKQVGIFTEPIIFFFWLVFSF